MTYFGELRSSIQQARREPARLDRVVWWSLQGAPFAPTYAQRALEEHAQDLAEMVSWLTQSAGSLHQRIQTAERDHLGLGLTTPKDTHRWLAALAWLLVTKRTHPGEAACLMGARHRGRAVWVRWLIHTGWGAGFRPHPHSRSGHPGERVTFDVVCTCGRPALEPQAFPGQLRRLHDVGSGTNARAFVRAPNGALTTWSAIDPVDPEELWLEEMATRCVDELRQEEAWRRACLLEDPRSW